MEIALLSQFDNENIVQYYVTDKGKKRKDTIYIALADDTRDQPKIRMNNVVITPFKTQTRIWLGEVLHKRLHDQLTISDLLADGELLYNSVDNMALPCGNDSDEFLIDGLDDDSSHRGASRFWRSHFKFI
ncbi:hypothetical protein ACSBR2_039479 [Camellia fascicularis]